jgi:predicted amidohydrolase YtcJ
VKAAHDLDLILAEGNIYTVNEKQPHAEAIAVKGDRIAFVGLNDSTRQDVDAIALGTL